MKAFNRISVIVSIAIILLFAITNIILISGDKDSGRPYLVEVSRLSGEIEKSGNIPDLSDEKRIEYAKGIKPQLIIMGTRGTEKKEKELIGSVTGEVLDGCRFPVLAIPETANITNLETFVI